MKSKIMTLLALLAAYCGTIVPAQMCYSQSQISPEARRRIQELEAPILALSQQAQDLVTRGRLAEGAKLFEQVIANDGPREWDRLRLADVYTQLGQPDDVLRVLEPVFHPIYRNSLERDPGTRMLYTLALLDKHRWGDAVAMYEPTIDAKPKWYIPGRGPGHTLPDLHFTAHSPKYSELRAQAHLILGTAPLRSLDVPDQTPYMLNHLKLAIKYNPRSPDAHFVSGLLLMQTGRLAEARIELEATAKVAPYEAQAEIQAALAELKKHEDSKKLFESQQAARAAAASEASGPFK